MSITNESEQLENFKRDLKSLLEKHDATIGYDWEGCVTGPYEAYMDVSFGNSKSVQLAAEHYINKDNL